MGSDAGMVGAPRYQMKLPRSLTGILRGIAKRILAGKIRKIAESPDEHPRLHALYWKLAGYKTLLSVPLGLVAAVLAGVGETEAALVVGSVAGFLVSVGLVDKAWRADTPPAVRASPVYRFLAANSAEVATVLGALAAATTACDPETASMLARVNLDCAGATKVLAGLSVGLVWLGLYDVAGAADPPKTPLEE